MCSRSVIVHRPSRLGSAAAVLAAELRCGNGVFAMLACERGHVVQRLNRVMSHSFKSSPPAPLRLRTKVTKAAGWVNQCGCRASQSIPSECFILCRQGDGNRTRFLSPLTLLLCRTGYNICRLQVERRHKASGRISIDR